MKLGRKYRLTIDMENGDQVVVTDPITLVFSVDRKNTSSANEMAAQIYNLGKATRDKIFQDWFRTAPTTYRKVVLEAGYDGEFSILFAGDLRSCSSSRSGSDIITTISVFSGGLDTITAQTNQTLKAGTTLRELNQILIGAFPNLKEGALTDKQIIFERPVVLSGNSFYLLRKYNNDRVFIDNEIVHCLDDDAYIDEGGVVLINDETGLLDTPRREDSFLTITTLFEPRIIIGQIIELQSSILPLYNGQYKVVGMQHQGTISGAVGGQCISRFNLLLTQDLYPRLRKAEMAAQ